MLATLLAIPFVLALLVGLLPEHRRRAAAWLAGLAPVAGLVLLALMTPDVVSGEGVRSLVPWIPAMGLDLSLRLDGLAWMFAGLVLGIGALIVLYARYYLSETDSMPRFLAFLLLFMGAMLGMVLAGNLVLLAVFWELTSVSSFLLIGFWNHRQDARDGARMALAITGAGGLALLGGVILIGRIVGSYELDVVLQAAARPRVSRAASFAGRRRMGGLLLGSGPIIGASPGRRKPGPVQVPEGPVRYNPAPSSCPWCAGMRSLPDSVGPRPTDSP